ncbi:MAG TPA: biotin transporter BioY [Candidatus Limnocylindria bacterium]
MLSAQARPLALVLAPSGLWVRAVLVVLGSALIALAAQLAIPLPGSPVPVTGQTFAVLLVGAALGPRFGPVSVALYVVEGLIGLPVFAGGTSGATRIAGPTGGYLAGFVLAAFVVGFLAERGWDRRIWTCVLAMLAGEVVIYVFGLAGLSRFSLPNGVIEAGLLPFLIGDAYKVALATIALPAAWRFLPGLLAAK